MRQPELLQRGALPVQPAAGLEEPRLWVKKLTIWRNRDEALREIELRRGLNIIWSPDASAGSGVIGHGGGKTMLCRMLRYCLGEDGVAPEGQRGRIWEALPDGFLTAEVRLDGQDWLIVRSLGHRRRDFALRDGSLADVLAPEARPTGLGPFGEALSAAFVESVGMLMPARVGGPGAWAAALAWLTRDQECRFDRLLHWRDPSSDSRSPIAGTSEGERLEIVRALINALTTGEQEVRRQEEALTQSLTKLRTELGYRDWELRTLGGRLSQALQLPSPTAPSPLEAEILERAARDRLAKVLGAPGSASFTDLASARARRNEASDALRIAERDLAVAEAQSDTMIKLVSYQEAELGPLSIQVSRGETPACPVCKVAVDRVLAEGCNISLEPCDLPALRAEYERKIKEAEQGRTELNRIAASIKNLKSAVALGTQKLTPLEKAVAALEAAQANRSRQVREAERLVDDAHRLAEAISARSKTLAAIEAAEAELGRVREALAIHRAQAADKIAHLSRRYDDTLRALVPGEVSGSLKLDGNGLNLRVSMGGDRTSAAIESLKIVAFDLAVLVRSIEGETKLPAFLIHDSPREADLGRSIYDLLFHFAESLELAGGAPMFQYIVTTTTSPPEALRKEPWVRLELHGAPPDQRLLRTDL
jgi:hypothetical protein